MNKTPIPKTPLALTLSGILPFVGLAFAIWHWRGDIALQQTAALWLLVYGAVIASFLGGVRWGAATTKSDKPSGSTLALAVLPPLIAWVLVGLFFRYLSTEVFLAMAVLFALLYIWDKGSVNLQRWYRDLRIWPTLGATASLLAAYLLLR